MDKQPRQSERNGRSGAGPTPPDRESRNDRSGRGAATALERMKQLERETEWLRRKDEGKPDPS